MVKSTNVFLSAAPYIEYMRLLLVVNVCSLKGREVVQQRSNMHLIKIKLPEPKAYNKYFIKKIYNKQIKRFCKAAGFW